MARLAILLTVIVAESAAYVYTCKEIKSFILKDRSLIYDPQACIVFPIDAPQDVEPYSKYYVSTELVDMGTLHQYGLAPFLCETGKGPWTILTEDYDNFVCSSDANPLAEVFFLVTSADTVVTRVDATSQTVRIGKGTHTFVAVLGSLVIEKRSIDEGKETTLKFYTGTGASEHDERFALMPEKFIAGTSTVITGPVTTIVIEDGVTVELVLTSFSDKYFISAQPGFEFSLMSSGYANNYQSSFQSILVSTAYGINDDSIAYDFISVTGTVKYDPDYATTLAIECYRAESGKETNIITHTRDVIINSNCSSLDITYQGSLAPLQFDESRSTEVIYMRVSSNSVPVLKTSDAPDAPNTAETTAKPAPSDATDEPNPTGSPATVMTRRTPPPTSTTSAAPTTSAEPTKIATVTTTMKPVVTTSVATEFWTFSLTILFPILLL